jgi:integrase
MSSVHRKYIQQWIDRRSGKPRYYFRRPGFKRVPLPGSPWSPEFEAAYTEAMAGQRPPIISPRREFLPGTMNALAVAYFTSMGFRSLKPSTQSFYRSLIDRLCKDAGDNRVALLQRRHVVAMMAERSVIGPDSANGLRKVLRGMMKHAIEIGLRQDDPTRDVRAIRSKSDGYHSWTDDEIAQFEACHPVGSRARLAFALLLYTGQRLSDVIRMGPQHIRNGLLRVKQVKTGAELLIPVAPQLQEIIAATEGQMIFLMTQYDKPFSQDGFGHWFRAECNKAGLPHCSAHGLRKACARRLANAGCSQHEIAAITGHDSLKEVVRYTKGADQKRLAVSAMQKLSAENETSPQSVNGPEPVDKKSKLS